ncbi:hypothetical protein V2J09_013848, partial [Rumex salicifolius]
LATDPSLPSTQLHVSAIITQASGHCHQHHHSNHFSWGFVIFSTLEAFDVDDFVLQKPMVKPNENEKDEIVLANYGSRRKQDRLVLVWLRYTLSDRLLTYVARAQTAYEAWSMIESMFHTQTRARFMLLKDQLQTMSKGSMSMFDYIKKKQSVVDALAKCEYLMTSWLVSYEGWIAPMLPSRVPSTSE